MNAMTIVPIRPLKKWRGRPGEIIDFGRPHVGVMLRDVLSRANLGAIERSNEPILHGIGTICLHLSWPGYTTGETYHNIYCAQMTKAKLVLEVSQLIAAFLYKCAAMPVSKEHLQWRIGHGGITIERVILFSITDVGNGIWQAEIGLTN